MTDEIKCHAGEPHYPGIGPDRWEKSWKGKQPYSHSLRCCSYCGSLHPEDLITALANGATTHEADWKYGWPHKLYIEGVPNELAGQTVEVGSESGPGYRKPIMGVAGPHAFIKFYTQHIGDMPDDRIRVLSDIIEKQTGISFEKDDVGLRWRRRAVGGEAAPT